MYLRKACNVLLFKRFMVIFIFGVIQWTYQPHLALGGDQGMKYMDSDCHALKLKTATGVPQNEIHTYEFLGTCNINSLQETGPKVEKTVPAIGSAVWDSSKLELKEFLS